MQPLGIVPPDIVLPPLLGLLKGLIPVPVDLLGLIAGVKGFDVGLVVGRLQPTDLQLDPEGLGQGDDPPGDELSAPIDS